MTRIASALLIVAAVLALNGGMLRDAFAEAYPPVAAGARTEPVRIDPPANARLLSLLVVLESLRQVQATPAGPKV